MSYIIWARKVMVMDEFGFTILVGIIVIIVLWLKKRREKREKEHGGKRQTTI